MSTRLAPVVVASGLFAAGAARSGAGWFEDQRGETLAKALLAAGAVMVAVVIVAATLWVIGVPRARPEWLVAAAVSLAAPVDVVAPAAGLSARVAVVPLLDAALITAGVTEGPSFAYHEAIVFPGGDGWSLPRWPILQFLLAGAAMLALGRPRRHGARERLQRIVFLGSARGAGRR